MTRRATLIVVLVWAVSAAACVFGALFHFASFARAWLPIYLLWLGVPLAGVTLVLTHDLTGGGWMATARPALKAAIATMPLASLAGIPAFVDLHAIYDWTHPSHHLDNAFYLNVGDFYIRYGVCVALWNLLAAFALFVPRIGGRPISPGLSWISALGLVALALSASFAAIDWILSLEPTFWSSAFPYAQLSSWFNTGMAAVVLIVALTHAPSAESREHTADLARILLATTIFWAYIEFIQFLIVWEEDLSDEIPWYIKRLHSAWTPVAYVDVLLGFVVPFFVLLWAPSKNNRTVVAAVCVSILLSRIAHVWLLTLPEFPTGAPFWLDAAALLALGGVVGVEFALGWRYLGAPGARRQTVLSADHG